MWTVADAQANLPEVLRLAETEEAEEAEPCMPLGQWLVENAPRGTNLVVPDDEYSDDEIPWTEETDE